jgi:hypothetical protein
MQLKGVRPRSAPAKKGLFFGHICRLGYGVPTKESLICPCQPLIYFVKLNIYGRGALQYKSQRGIDECCLLHY